MKREDLLAKLNDAKKTYEDAQRSAEKALKSDDIEAIKASQKAVTEARSKYNELNDFVSLLDSNTSNGDGKGDGKGDGNGAQQRSAGLDPTVRKTIATSGMIQTKGDDGEGRKTNLDPTETMEYRSAFMEYVKTGNVSDVLQRSDVPGTSTDVGILVPQTVIQKIITEVDKIYGQLYSRVRKTNMKGGVKYPIGSFNAVVYRIDETGENAAPTGRQKGGSVTGWVEFGYLIGEIRIAQTLLASILSVPAFEAELSKVMAKAYVREMDYEIIRGNSENGQMEGILTEAEKVASRIPAENIITFTEDDMKDWKAWQKNLFAKIPLSMRGLNPEFFMTAETYESNIKTLHDNNNRPVYYETYNPVDGTEVSRFKGKNVVFVENDVLDNFDDEDAEYFGLYMVAEEGYAINENMQFLVNRYFDNEKHQWVDNGIFVNDGKVLDPKYIYILKKVASI